MAEEDKKTPAQLEREKIEVVASENKITDEEDNENETEENNEEEIEEKVEEEVKEEDNKKSEEDNEEDEVKEEDDPEKLKKTIERLKRRISTKSSSEKELKEQLIEIQSKLKKIEEDGASTLTEEDVKTRASEEAKAIVAQKEFDEACNRLAEEAEKIDKNFTSKVVELGEDYGKIPPVMIDILDDIKTGGAVLNYLCDNPEEYEKIRVMKPGRMATKLTEISEQLKPKKAVKEISKVPDPIKPVKQGSGSESGVITLTGKEDMKEWVRKREEQIARKRGVR